MTSRSKPVEVSPSSRGASEPTEHHFTTTTNASSYAANERQDRSLTLTSNSNDERSTDSLFWLAPAALALSHLAYLYDRLSSPIWGSYADSLFCLPHVLGPLLVIFLAWSPIERLAKYIGRPPDESARPRGENLLATVLWLSVTPLLAHRWLFPWSRVIGPRCGPPLLQVLFLWPVIATATKTAAWRAYWPDIGSFKISVLTKALIICWTYMLGYVIVGRLRWWTYLPQTYLHTLTTHDWIYLYRDAFIVLFITRDVYVQIRRARKIRMRAPHLLTHIVVVGVVLTILRSYWLIPTEGGQGSISQGRVVAKQESVTGLVIVGQYERQGRTLRYLRCDHSLLGGLWLDPDDAQDLSLAEAIYKTFHLQEAVRLIQRPSSPSKIEALVIGLGAGTVVNGLEQHSIRTTVVEVDPAVAKFAEQFFGCRDPSGGLVLEDARRFLSTNIHKYHYIIHDVFTGGSMPARLFTRETWEAARDRLLPGGIVVVNIAGNPKSRTARTIVATLVHAFAECRGFRDTEDESADNFNMVIFCSSAPIAFRAATESDYLGSYQRRIALQDFQEREVDLSEFRLRPKDRLLSDANARHLDLSRETREHWHVMRRTLPDKVWELY